MEQKIALEKGWHTIPARYSQVMLGGSAPGSG